VTAAAEPVLSVSGLTVALPPGGDRRFAVEDVSLELHAREILCLVGESGSGKSVLSSALMGALAPGLRVAKGEIALGDEDLTRLSEAKWRDVRGRRIAMIPQEPTAALNPSMTVGRQIAEVFAIHDRLTPAERRAEALRLIADMHLPEPERIAGAYPHQLSGGQCQRIGIAMALAMGPEVLIADEPTTALDVTTQAQVLKLICELRDRRGHAVLFVTHDLGVVADIADRVAVMQNGRLVEIGAAAQVLQAPRHPYTQALIAAMPRFTPKPGPADGPRDAGPCLQIRGLTKFHGAVCVLQPIALDVERGSTLAIVGESGSGKTTLARLLVRLSPPTSGEIRLNGEDFHALGGKPLRRARRRIQMIFQDPYGALNPRRTVGAAIARAAVLAGDDRASARARARDLLERVGLGPAAYGRRPAYFSGGQRQRVGIARALAMRPEILIADESVSALDVSVQAQILALLATLQRELGLTLLFITHDLRVAAQICDDVVVMQHGRIVEQGPAAQVLTNPQQAYTKQLLDAAPGRQWDFANFRPVDSGLAIVS
jgi:peptide/nickel transport system ATP-binding protein